MEEKERPHKLIVELARAITERLMKHIEDFQESPKDQLYVTGLGERFVMTLVPGNFGKTDLATAKELLRRKVYRELKRIGMVYCYICPDNQEVAIEPIDLQDPSWRDSLDLYDDVPIKVFKKEFTGKLYEGWD